MGTDQDKNIGNGTDFRIFQLFSINLCSELFQNILYVPIQQCIQSGFFALAVAAGERPADWRFLLQFPLQTENSGPAEKTKQMSGKSDATYEKVGLSAVSNCGSAAS